MRVRARFTRPLLLLAILGASGALVVPRANAVGIPGDRVNSGPGQLTWMTGVTSLPQPLTRPAVAVGTNGKIYVFGGTDGVSHDYNTTYIYNPRTNAWAQGTNMPTAREGAEAVMLPDGSGRIAVLGGGTGCFNNNLCSSGTVFSRVEVYDPSSNSWSILAPMNSPRYRFAAVAYQGRVYAMGGSNGSAVTPSVESYNPSSHTWTYSTLLPQPEESPMAALDATGSRIYLFGGFDGSSTSAYNNLYIFDGRRWTSGPPLLQATTNGGATLGPDGQIYVVGGYDNSFLTTVQVYNPATAAWSTATPLPAPTCCMGLVTALNGEIYSLGNAGPSAQVFIYGPYIDLSSYTGQPGATIAVAGDAFVPNATISVYWGSPKSGTLLGTRTSDGRGNLPPLLVTIPSTATAGLNKVTAVDDLSRYPVNAPFIVQSAGS